MTGKQYATVVAFETSLKIGQPVLIRWTNNGCYYSGCGTVSKINRKSLRVALVEEVSCQLGGQYRIGREILAPRIDDIDKWSCHNRVEPIGGY